MKEELSKFKNDDNEHHTYLNDEQTNTLYMISQFLDDLKEDFEPFVNQTIEILLTILNKNSSESIKNESAKIYAKLI